MNRRELFQLAASAFVSLSAASAGEHRMPAMLTETVGKALDWKPALFTPAQNRTVTVLAEQIIPRTDTPGAADANVNRYIDLFLASGNTGDKDQFLRGIDWLDAYCVKIHKTPFAECSSADRDAILTAIATAKDPALEPGRRFFGQAKNLTSIIYYSTAEGFKELNKFGPPPVTYGCTHPSHA